MTETTVEELAETAGIEAMGRAVLVFAENERLKAQLGEAQQQLRYWWEAQHSCPCGARAEALDTHPHVLTCPTARAGLEKHG